MRRDDWVAASAAALVVGAMALLLGMLLNPLTQESDDVSRVISDAMMSDGRWLGTAVVLFWAAIGLTAGLPALMTLVAPSRVAGLAGICVFAVGTIGLAGYAVALMFVRALLLTELVPVEAVELAADERGLSWFLVSWAGSFYLGLVLLTIALFRARLASRWVPGAFGLFLVSGPALGWAGDAGTVLQFFVLSVAFTGAALTAVQRLPDPAAAHSR